MTTALRFLTFGVALSSVLTLSSSNAWATAAGSLGTPFGTDGAGSPLTWSVSAVGFGSYDNTNFATVDGSGLHFNFGITATATATGNSPSTSLQVQSNAGGGNPFAVQTNNTPWFEVSWIENNTGGSKIPNIDFFLTGSLLSNRSAFGNLFGTSGGYVVQRWTTGTVHSTWAGDAFQPRATAGTDVPHTVRIGKRADGTMDILFDGELITSSRAFADEAGMDTSHSVWHTIEMRVRGGDSGDVFTFSSVTMGDDHSWLPGDTDGDGDIDNSDLGQMFGNFTGPGLGAPASNPTGSSAGTHINQGGAANRRLGYEGDVDGDYDVDNSDLGEAFGGFTGPIAAGNLVDTAGEADLIYDPATGNVKLDATEATGGVITNFVLQNAAGGMDFNAPGTAVFPTPTSSKTDLATELSWTDGTQEGFSGIWELGNVFPTGLDLTGLAAFLTRANYVGEIGTGNRVLDLVVVAAVEEAVPEPGTLVLMALGCVAGIGVLRRRRKTRAAA